MPQQVYSAGMRYAAQCAALALAALGGVPLGAQAARPVSICGGLPDGGSAVYLRMPVGQMRDDVPDLRGIKAGNAEDTEAILRQAGAVLSGMIPRVPNLLAAEELSQTLVKLPFLVDEGQHTGSGTMSKQGMSRSAVAASQMTSSTRTLSGRELEQTLHGLLATPVQRSVFQYRVTSTPDPVFGHVLEEYRTTAENEAVVLADAPGSPRGIGFSKEWLLFMPQNLSQSRFRYLGRQKIDGHESDVVAFAQIPEKVTLPAEIQTDIGTCPYFTQGVVWIDRADHEIVRLQTDLLAPVPAINLRQLRTQTRFGEVRIAGLDLRLWLPGQTEILWSTKDNAGGELHRYSGYKLFATRVTLKDRVVD